MNIEMIPVDDIEVGDRLRAVDMDWAAVIAASMQENGQRQPIEVRKIGRSGKFSLVSGGHRLAAMKLAGIDHAAAIIVKASDLEARLLEIDENLCRHELTPLDKSTFLAERKAVYEELHPETKHGGDRKTDQVAELCHLIPSFTEATAERLGLTARSIRAYITRYKNIAPDVRQQLAGTWLADSGQQLDELARQTPEIQRKIVEFATQWPGVRKVSEILRQIEGRPKPKAAGTYEKFIAMWRKATPDERKQILTYLSPELPGFQTERAAA
ncbi:ParB N-terminal domain-containing protein [Gluconacetobacter entanii]|uniref:ParB N-terminal domain-containing protein n=1 Tax=Gluconacetobacter entanii TaxID=108528 RepID=A0ABT3K1V2_9PROT|nr:ParB N-terminal domain-containing protein [Gluconacetobacter entanii]MCW4589376.1 ParB N-terminal domain-containing protein [Gluconacetobacter entanii]MCW4593007.1 ParB N-terminal domain-containing protein [Gluconacetobacter entanii]NPC90217.1 ParB N-terminal domain-containing protein [Gluconacetobacter entanii]